MVLNVGAVAKCKEHAHAHVHLKKKKKTVIFTVFCTCVPNVLFLYHELK